MAPNSVPNDQGAPQAQFPTLRKLHVGVVGIGRMGRRHAVNILHKTPRASLLCACSPAEADLAWAKDELIPHGVIVVPTFEEMIKTPGLEAVIIASATHLHLEQTMICLDKGIHVLCEKPICKTLEELESLVAKAEAKPQTKLMVGFVRRFDKDYREVAQQIQNQAIGQPVAVRAQAREPLDSSPAYKDYLRVSGGIFVDTVIHDIDLSLFFMGETLQPKSVSSMGLAVMHKQLEAEGDADTAVGMCEFWDGRMAYFYNSRITPVGYDNATEIYGTMGKLSVNLVSRNDAVELHDKNGHLIKAHPGWYERYAEAFVTEAISWVDALLNEKDMPVPLRSSLTSLKIATALQESLRTGNKIEFTRDGARKGVSTSL